MGKLTIKNHGSGELILSSADNHALKLSHEQAHRLILFARMHTVEEFVAQLPRLLPDDRIVDRMMEIFEKANTSSERWNIKEKFARLVTMVKGYQPLHPGKVIEEITVP